MKLIFSLIGFLSFFAATSQTYITKDIKYFGAKGDGKTNDNTAFQRAAAFFNKRGGDGTLTISKGIYIVGKQPFTGMQKGKAAYTGEIVLEFADIKNFSVKGAVGAKIEYINGIRIGSFSPTTGKVYDHGNTLFVDWAYAAFPATCIYILRCENIKISNLELDGNNENMILGGVYGDVGRQLQHDGILIDKCRNIVIDKVQAHNFGLDGICVQNVKSNLPDKIQISNSSFEYNARQGLSWIGGNELTATNCKFNHTGRGKFSSAPAGGVDVEAEVGTIRNGTFNNCEFIDNAGNGMGADSGDSGDCFFKNCIFWGISSYSVWVTKPNFNFIDCKFYGSLALGYRSFNKNDATKFSGCYFEDKIYKGREPFGTYLVESNNANYTVFENCTFISHVKKIIWLQSDGAVNDEKYKLINCTFTANNTTVPDGFLAVLRGVVSINCTFNIVHVDPRNFPVLLGSINPVTAPGSSGSKVLFKGKTLQ